MYLNCRISPCFFPFIMDKLCGISVYINMYFFIDKVGANAGIVGMTKEHLGLALALSVPVFVVVTKVTINTS